MATVFEQGLEHAKQLGRIAAIQFATLAFMAAARDGTAERAIHLLDAVQARRGRGLGEREGTTMWDSIAGLEIKVALRRLMRTPAFTVTAALCLALGFGSVITIVAVVNGLFLKPPPGIERPAELVTLHFEGPTSVPNVEDIRATRTGLAGIGAFTANLSTLRVSELAERVLAAATNAEYFTVLETRPVLGRFFLPDEDGPPDAHPIAVVSHDFWQRRLDSDPDALGTTVWLNGNGFSVIGVAPEGFLGTFTGFPTDVWVPLAAASVVSPGFDPADRAGGGLEFIARLSEGASASTVTAALATVAARLEEAYPEANRDLRLEAREHTGFDEEIRMPVLVLASVLMGFSALVMLIACLNFTNLLLARSAGRTTEVAIRKALGVGSARLVLSLLTENLVLASIGSIMGLAIAHLLSGTFSRFLTVLPVRIHLDTGVDLRVAMASAILAVVVAILAGLAPALRLVHHDIGTALRGKGGGGIGGTRLLRMSLISQLGGSAALLAVAGLFLQTVARGVASEPGFDMDRLHVVPLVEASLLHVPMGDLSAFFNQVEEEVRAVPGVVAVASASALPSAFGGLSTTEVQLPGVEPPPGLDGFEATMAIVSPSYHETMGIDVLRGRALLDSDRTGQSPVAVVSASFAARHWPGQEAVGREFEQAGISIRVIGVVNDVLAGLEQVGGETFYLPLAQRPRGTMNLLVRLANGARDAPRGVAVRIREFNPDLPSVEPQPVEDFMLLSLLPQRVASTVGGSLGLAGALLAALGVYGLVAFSVTQRRREIGVRMAVGADPRHVLFLVLLDTLRMAAWGLGLGLVLALGAGGAVSSLLIGVEPWDPLPFGAAAVLVVSFATLASLGPARIAAATSPVVALKG